jgi:ketosteroid isomerase-like protein
MAEQSPSQLISDWVTAAQSNDTPSNKATKIANLYADSAVYCATEGIIQGQSNIKTDYEQNFQAGWVLKGITNQSINQGTDKDWAWAYGQWTGSAPDPQDPKTILQLQGCWSIVFVAPTSNNWLIQQHTIVTNPVT